MIFLLSLIVMPCYIPIDISAGQRTGEREFNLKCLLLNVTSGVVVTAINKVHYITILYLLFIHSAFSYTMVLFNITIRVQSSILRTYNYYKL